MEDFSHSVVFATKTGIALLLRHQSMSKILALIHSYLTQKKFNDRFSKTGSKSLLKKQTKET